MSLFLALTTGDRQMKSRSAITKLKAILVIDVIIVSLLAGTYFYLQNEGLIVGAPKEAEFTVADLRIAPLEAEVGDPISISVNATNIGDIEGVYRANLTVNNELRGVQEILLSGKESKLVEFTVFENAEGDYDVEVDGLSGAFKIKPLAPEDSKIVLSDLRLNPYEAWVNETITAKLIATNPSEENESITLKLTIDGILVETRKIELAAHETKPVEFTFVATTEGKFTVKINTLSGSFNIVKTGYHTFNISRSGGGSRPLTFTLNEETKNTPYIELLPVGQYRITVPDIVDVGTGILEFAYWSDELTSTTRTFTLDKRSILVATYKVISGYASCPSLFFWNGTNYVYVTEVSNAGWLGYMDHINESGEIVFAGGTPWDYVKLDRGQLAARNDYYDIVLFQQWDEIFYLDTAYLMVTDHPASVDVYSSMSNYVNQAFNGRIYSVSKDNLLTPVSAFNEKGENVLPQISELDGVFTQGTNGFASSSWDNITLNQLTLDLGDLHNAEEIKLLINGMVDWGPPQPYYTWVESFKIAFNEGTLPDLTPIYPAPYMEIKNAGGGWTRVPQDRQMPTPSDYVPRSFVVDLTGLFPAGVKEYQIRITNFFNVTFDYVGVDTTSQEEVVVQRIDPIATLDPLDFGITNSTASGWFTRYGDVTQLLLTADDMFVIGMQGDRVSLRFSTAALPTLEDGMERDYFLFVACWFKDPPWNWGYGFEFTVEPLPFQDMSGFPYPPTESYPSGEDHVFYLRDWNTRAINTP